MAVIKNPSHDFYDDIDRSRHRTASGCLVWLLLMVILLGGLAWYLYLRYQV